MYDYRIYSIAVDGKIVGGVYDGDYDSFILDYKFLKKTIKNTQVDASEILFVLYEFEHFARKIVDYDANNYGYTEMYNLISNQVTQSKDISKELNMKILAHGVEF